MSANMGGDGDNGRLVNAVVQDIEALEYRLWTEGQLLDRLGIAGVRLNNYGAIKRALENAGVRMQRHKMRAGVYLGFERRPGRQKEQQKVSADPTNPTNPTKISIS